MEQVIYGIEKLICKYTYYHNYYKTLPKERRDWNIDYLSMAERCEIKIECLKEVLVNINSAWDHIRTLEKLEKKYNNDTQYMDKSNIKPMLSLNECWSNDNF